MSGTVELPDLVLHGACTTEACPAKGDRVTTRAVMFDADGMVTEDEAEASTIAYLAVRCAACGCEPLWER